MKVRFKKLHRDAKPLLTVEQSLARNRHNVRREDIERMAAQWEPWERKQEESENGT